MCSPAREPLVPDVLPADQAARIREAFPDLDGVSAEFAGAGWDHDTWLLGHETLLRVPRHPVDPGYFTREAAFLDLLGRHTTVNVPEVSHLSADASLLGYRALPGSTLTDAGLATLSTDQFERVAEHVATLFSEVHAIPAEETGHLDPIVRRGIDHVEWLQNGIEQQLRGVIPDRDCDAFEQFLPELGETIDTAPLQVVLHGDFGLDAVVTDDQTGQVGFIDFSDWAIGDPAMDFGGLTWSAPELAEAVLDRYRLKTAAGDVLARARVYNKMIAAGLMIHAQIGADISIEDARADFLRRFGLV